MGFYIIVRGHVTLFEFPYVNQKDSPVRIEKTRIHGKSAPSALAAVSTDVYAYEVMCRSIETLHPIETVKSAQELFTKKRCHHIPLVIDHRLVGLVSTHDLVQKPDLWDTEQPLQKFMTKTVLATHDTTPLRHIVEVFLHENINALPVIDDDLKLVGIITTRDLLRWGVENNRFQKDG